TASAASRLLDHLPVFFDRDDAGARGFLNLRGAAEMIDMPVAQNDVFDALRIETDFSDVIDDVVDIRFLRCVEQDVPFRGCQQPNRNETRPDIIKVVEHLEGFDLLELNVVGTSDPIGLAQWL